jgi:transcriptional regulator with XRE-family HTH domain
MRITTTSYENEAITIGEMLKLIRTNKNFTQKHLGDLCHMDGSQIRKYETGKIIPKSSTLLKILQVLEVNHSVEEWDKKYPVPTIITNNHASNELIMYCFKLNENKAYKADLKEFKNLLNRNQDKPSLLSIIIDLTYSLNDLGKQKIIDYMEDLILIDKYKK